MNKIKFRTRSSLKKNVWKIFSEYIRRRDHGQCFTCSIIKDFREMHAGHYIPRTICGDVLYFSELNVHCQCPHCNKWMHGNLSEYARHLVLKYGAKVLEKINKIKKEKKTLSFLDLQRMYDEYTLKLKNMKQLFSSGGKSSE